jgi:CheY-like chemotaxis protein
MNKLGPIIIVEDDPDDQEIITGIFLKLDYPNEVIFFHNCEKTLEYLEDTNVNPFLIISDINLPILNGLELREKIHNNEQLRLRCIPYLFLTTTDSHQTVVDAYSKSVQGFFIKPDTLTDFERILKNIVEYWLDCRAPNKVV